MIELFIFHLHIVAALYAFTKNWQKTGLKDGILAVAVIALFFTIGWALTGSIARLVMPTSVGFFTSDTLSLVLLVIPEAIFFYKFYVKERIETVEQTSL